MQEIGEGQASIVSAITSPLGFFALSLLIVEGFLTITLVGSDLDVKSKFIGMTIGAGLFVVVVIGVLILVWFKPTNLTYGEKSHLELEKQKFFGTSENPSPRTEAIINAQSLQTATSADSVETENPTSLMGNTK